jgi:hypothetical protein
MGVTASLLAVYLGLASAAAGPTQRFREASELARSGDYPKAVAVYQELASAGAESASLYWNWGQVASARGAIGEAMWACLRARELDPGDGAVRREIERLREAANLDPAEIAPEPLVTLARTSRRFHLDLVALSLLGASLLLHAAGRLLPGSGRTILCGWVSLSLGAAVAMAPLAGSFARGTGVVLRRGVPLGDAASPTSEALGTLREGEVVPILDRSAGYLRIEDSSGARGWARSEDVRALDGPPPDPRAAPGLVHLQE